MTFLGSETSEGAPLQSSSPPGTSVDPRRIAGRPRGSSAESPLDASLRSGTTHTQTARSLSTAPTIGPTGAASRRRRARCPVITNSRTANAQGYRDYFGARAPALYYSYNLGAWHLIALSGDINVSAGSPQERWLRRDLARHPRRCVLAYWHEPRFTSGTGHSSDPRFDPFWRALYAARADVVLNGHVHNYERFARQSPSGRKTPKGIREFVIGTGGTGHYASGRPIKHSQVQNDTTFGVLKLRLLRKSYRWKFVRAAGRKFHDSGTTRCSRRPKTFRAAAATSSRTTGEGPSPLMLSYGHASELLRRR